MASPWQHNPNPLHDKHVGQKVIKNDILKKKNREREMIIKSCPVFDGYLGG